MQTGLHHSGRSQGLYHFTCGRQGWENHRDAFVSEAAIHYAIIGRSVQLRAESEAFI